MVRSGLGVLWAFVPIDFGVLGASVPMGLGSCWPLFLLGLGFCGPLYFGLVSPWPGGGVVLFLSVNFCCEQTAPHSYGFTAIPSGYEVQGQAGTLIAETPLSTVK